MMRPSLATMLWYAAVTASLAVVVVLMVGAVWFRPSASPRDSGGAAAYQTYLSPQLRVWFRYPAGWHAVAGYAGADGLPLRFAGADGFWQLASVSGDQATLTQAAVITSDGVEKPFGDNPRITTVEAAREPAALITPRQGDIREAALVVQYPAPVEISGTLYRFLVLKADREHMLEFARSLRFIGNTTGEISDLPNILVYSPAAGDQAKAKVVALGVARTFESTVSGGLYDSTGAALVAAFATAQAPEVGTYGAFHLELTVPELPAATALTLKVFQASAKDGAPIDVVEVPIWVPE